MIVMETSNSLDKNVTSNCCHIKILEASQRLVAFTWVLKRYECLKSAGKKQKLNLQAVLDVWGFRHAVAISDFCNGSGF